MPAVTYKTTDELIDSIKARISAPTSQNMLKKADFIRFINEEFLESMVPKLMQLHEEYFVAEEDQAFVTGQNRYSIPDRAVGQKLRDLWLRDSTGNIIEMRRLNPDDVSKFGSTATSNINHYPYFYVEGGDIITLSSSLSGSLAMRYFKRPNKLVADNECATITNIAVDGLNTVLSLSSLPTRFSLTLQYDLVRTYGSHDIRAMDLDIVAFDSVSDTVTFLTTDIPSTLVIGDYVAIAGEAFIPMIPDDLHAQLAHRAGMRCLEAMSDTQGLQQAQVKLSQMEAFGDSMTDNRVEGAPLKVNNIGGLLRSSRVGRRRGGW